MLVLPYKMARALRDASHYAPAATRLLALTWLLSAGVSSARAEDQDVAAAANAYTQAQQAELGGNLERAAELFELADRIAPAPEALRSATRVRLATGQLIPAAADAEELLRRYHDDPSSRELADKVLVRAKAELARYAFACAAPCTVVVDGLATGAPLLRDQVVYASPGAHEVVIGFEGELSSKLRLQGKSGESQTLAVQRPAPPALGQRQVSTNAVPMRDARLAAPARRSRFARLSPTYFWIASGVTVAAGAVTLWSGLDLIKAHDDFTARAHPTRAQFDDGESKDRRTSALIGVTSVLAVSTAALALFTDFAGRSSEQRPRANVSLDTRGAHLTYGGRF